MKKISGSTFYFKKLFPTVWFGFLFIFFITSLSSGASQESLMFLIMPIFMAGFGFILFKKLVWDLADEVIDLGDHLLFKKGSKEQRVYFKDMININHQMSSPEKITIHTRETGAIGNEVSFNPPTRFNPLAKNPIYKELIARMDSARNT
ncbi:hypothetical protein [Thalassotalea mangrovi]|uniref:PH domain-containing protein n=1 Tax=Thalassotalea mangrovi TaxID=2572245 RepID=A0A4V5NUQ8_9GAMM|nr:hypothetical protein [Thalassotalea mangrovi]TKB47412.1 hypothetical protein E8M12_01080 [Thalassotalea mangrovi]